VKIVKIECMHSMDHTSRVSQILEAHLLIKRNNEIRLNESGREASAVRDSRHATLCGVTPSRVVSRCVA
jgi:hypothetical protein